MIRIKQNGDIYEIAFKYDPELISIIKDIPGRQWLPGVKLWTIPKDKLGWLLRYIKGTHYEDRCVIESEEQLNQNAMLNATRDIPEIDVSNVPFYVKKDAKPYDHQIDFMKYSIHRQRSGNMNGFLLADEPGLAKTCESMNLALYNRKEHNFKHCLVICCINTSKYNWYEDIKLHTQGKEVPYILGTRFKRDKVTTRANTGSKEKLADLQTGHMYGDVKKPKLPYFLIVNIEAFRAKSGKHFIFTEEVIKWVNEGKINMIMLDEIHKNCSPTSMQGKQILELKKKTNMSAMWLPMTGTPITSKPTDIFLPLKLIDAHRFTSYYTWCKEFCIYGGYDNHEIVGYKNIPRLSALLHANMLRRLKSDVLDLPPKIRYTRYVENTNYQQNLYNDIAEDIVEHYDDFMSSMNPLAKFLRLRQVNGSPELVDESLKVDQNYLKYNAKLQALLEEVDDIVERGEKVIIFSNWVEPLRTLYRFVSRKYKTCCYTGTMSSEDREKHKRVFQTNPEYKVIIGTIGALGTSHTLTAAQNVIFYDEPWNPDDKLQAEDRAYRVGTTKSVNIITLIARDTVDDRVHEILESKDHIAKYVVDGRLDIKNNPDLFYKLLGDTKSIKSHM